MKKILLDSSAFAWAVLDEPLLGPKSKDAIASYGNVYISAISILELKIKTINGKLSLGIEIEDALSQMQIEVLAFNERQALDFQLFSFNKDPFDNALCSIAIMEGLPFLTADKHILSSKINGLVCIDARK